MLVEVVRLRSEGVKLDREVTLRARPARGHLRFCLKQGIAHLHPHPYTGGMIPDIIPPMIRASIRSIDERGILIHGEERTGMYAMGPRFPQAWWVRPIAADASGA